MTKRNILEPPYVSYFFLFAHADIWFLLLLTTALWGWSGMSSLGLLCLLLVSPFPSIAFAFICMAIVAIQLFTAGLFVVPLATR